MAPRCSWWFLFTGLDVVSGQLFGVNSKMKRGKRNAEGGREKTRQDKQEMYAASVNK
jgi:hypothetical protein